MAWYSVVLKTASITRKLTCTLVLLRFQAWMNELYIQYLITHCRLRGNNMMRSRVVPFALIFSGTTQGVGLGGLIPPPPLFRMVKYIFFYFGSPDLSLTTQRMFSNLTILNTHKQRTDRLCLVAVAKVFVALKGTVSRLCARASVICSFFKRQ